MTDIGRNGASARWQARRIEPDPLVAGARYVVVPPTPGPLRDLSRGERSRDELDDMIDDLFGTTTPERPGAFDVVLVAIGIALLGWGLWLGGPDIARWAGLVAVVLGLALPARGVIRAYGRRRSAWLQRRRIGDGVLLDVSSRETADLADAYGRCLQAAGLPGVPLADEARSSAHQAMLEVASLLVGQPPVAAAQVAYVTKRTDALRELTAQLLLTHRGWLEVRARDAQAQVEEQREWAGAVARARDDLETSSDLGAVARLRTLSSQVRLAEQLRVEPVDDSR
jgi:hypothetical protein